MINIGSLVGTLELQDNATAKLVNFDQALNRTFGPFAQFQRQTNTIGIGLQSLGFQVARTGDRLTALTAGIVAAGAATVKLATDFQTNMTKVANLTEIGVQGVGRMRDSVLQLSPQLAQGPIELSDALYSIGSVGLTGSKALDTLTVSAKASAIGMGETQDVAKAVAAAVINYADSGMTAARAGDILTAAVKEGGAEADQFANSLGRVISTGKQVGVSFEEITASVATFTRLGVRADEAVTALRGTFAFLMKPAAGVVAELKKLGLEMDDIRRSVKERGLAQTLIDLVKIAGEDSDAIGKIIPNVRALAGVLANAGSQAEEYTQILAKVTNSTNTLNDAFEVVSETAGFKFQQALARLQVLGIQVGDILLPALVSVAEAMLPILDVVAKLVSAFGDLPGPVKTATLAFLAFSLALGPIMSISGRVIDAVGFFARAFTGLKNMFVTTATAATAAGDTIESAFAAIRARRIMEAYAQYMDLLSRMIHVSSTAPGGPGFPTGFSTVAISNMLLAEKAMHNFERQAYQTMLPLSKIRGLLMEATVPLARFSAGWAMAVDSTGNAARQLLAANPVITHTGEVLAAAVAQTGPFALGMSSIVEAGGRIAIALPPSTLAVEGMGVAGAAAATGMDAFAIAVGRAAASVMNFFAALKAGGAAFGGALLAGQAGGLLAVTAAAESASTALVLYRRSIITTTESYVPFILGTTAAAQAMNALGAKGGMKLLTEGVRDANLAMIPFNAALVKTETQAAKTASQLLLTGTVLKETGGLFAALTSSVVGMTAVVVGLATAFTASGIYITKTGGLIKDTFALLPDVINDLIRGFKDMAIIMGQMLVDAFKSVQNAADSFRQSLTQTMPTVVGFFTAMIIQEVEKAEWAAKKIKEAADLIHEQARRPITVESVLGEAAGREAKGSGTFQENIRATESQKKQLQELIGVYNELTTTLDNQGRAFQVSGTAAQVLSEKFEQLKAAGLAIPKEIEIFLKVRTIGVGGTEPELQTMGQFAAMARQLSEGSGGLAAGRLNAEMNTLRAQVAQADKELAKLSKTSREDLVYGIRSGTFTTKQLVDKFGDLFSSSAVAETAIKTLSNSTKEGMKAAERDTRWITTFKNSAKDLEAQLKSAFGKEQLPIGIILEEWGDKAEHTDTRMKALGLSTKGTLTEFLAESSRVAEANKPFEQIQANADKLNRIATAMFSNGRTVAEVYDVLGNSAVTAGEKAAGIGGKMGESLARIKAHADQLELDKLFARFDEELVDFQRSVAKTPATVEELDELNAMAEKWAVQAEARIQLYKDQQLPQSVLVRLTREEIDALRDQTHAYIANMKAIRESQYAIEDMIRAFEPDTLATRLDDVTIKFDRIRKSISATEKDAENYGRRMAALAAEEIQERENVTQAWLRHGAQTKANLEALARDATAQYKAMRDSGLFAAKDIEEAWDRMVQANIAAQDQWSGKFAEMALSLPDALGEAFSKMMFEAKTFKEFFVGIWEAIKRSLFNIFAEIVDAFIRQMLKKMMTSMAAAQTANAAIDFSAAGLEPMLGGGAAGGAAGGGMVGGSTAALVGGGALAVAGGVTWAQAGSSKFQNTMGGMLTGAGIGMMVGGPIGALIGAGVGAAAGYISSFFRKSETQKAMEEIGHGLGVNISEGLAKEIADLASTIEGGTKNQRRAIAEILSLDKIIEEGGGLSPQNVRTYEQAAMELFGVIERGGNAGKLAVGQLNTLVGMFAAQADKTGGVWDKNFQAIIKRAKETGLELENLTAALEAQMSKLASGVDKLTAGFAAETKKAFINAFKDLPGGESIAQKFWDALGDPEAMKKALEGMGDDFVKMFEAKFKNIPQLDDVAEKLWKVIGDPKELERAIDRLDLKPELEKKVREFLSAFDVDKITGQIGAKAQAQFDRLSRIAFASFNAIIAQGKTAVEAIDTIGESVDRLIELHDKLGLKGGAAYDALARFRNLVKDNRELVDSAIGLNDAMVALQNLGGMTVDLFQDMQLEGQDIYDRLTAAGFTSKEALKMMAPFLQNVVKIAKEFGYEIDANTQALIDQADEQGVLDKKMMDTNEILMRGFAAIIDALGGPMPDAFKDFAEDARRHIDDVNDDLDDMARPRHAKVIIDTETGEEIPIPPTEPGEPGPGGQPRPPTYATGGIVGARNIIPFPNLLAQNFSSGADSVHTVLSPGEMVLTQQDQTALLNLLRTPEQPTTTNPPPGVTLNFEEGAFAGMLAGAVVDSPERARELAFAIVTEFEKRGKLWNKARNALGVAS